MLKVELELPTVSAIALCGWVILIPPAGLAILLSAKFYVQWSLRVSAGLLGAMLLCLALSIIFLGAFPQRKLVLFVHGLLTAFTTAVGLHWISARFAAALVDGVLRYEIPCVCLWAISLLLASLLFGVEFVMLVLVPHDMPVEKLPPGEVLTDFEDSVQNFMPSPSFHVSHKKSSSSIFSLVRSKSSRGNLNEPAVPPNPLAGLEALPEGFQEPDWDVQSAAGQERLKWILAQTGLQSRNVSDSSNVTGTLFPATDYNRRISDMGFQKDEAFPLPRVRKQASFPMTAAERPRLNKSA